MNAESFDTANREFERRHPFRRYTVTMFNGEQVEIDRSDATVVRDGVAVYAAAGNIPVIIDHEAVSRIDDDFASLSD